jgi:uncharacterized phage protein (TIGR02220 family)
MIRIEGRGQGRGIIIDSKALEDPNLSFRAKGLLAYLQSRPRGSTADVKNLEKASLEGRAAIETALKELIDSGYVTRAEDPKGGAPGGVEPVTRGALMESLFGDSSQAAGSANGVPARQGRSSPMTKRDELRDRIRRVIDHLNLLRERHWDWAQYTPLSAKYAKNVEHISGRLADGYTEEDLIVILEYLAATDGGREESRRYFNCVTPFNTKNFESNLTMAREWEARGRQTAGPKRPGTSRGKDYYLGKRGEAR